jgi:hypothetical protein
MVIPSMLSVRAFSAAPAGGPAPRSFSRARPHACDRGRRRSRVDRESGGGHADCGRCGDGNDLPCRRGRRSPSLGRRGRRHGLGRRRRPSASRHRGVAGIRTLPLSFCEPVFANGLADLLVVSDLPLQSGIRISATQMAQAITFVLRDADSTRTASASRISHATTRSPAQASSTRRSAGRTPRRMRGTRTSSPSSARSTRAAPSRRSRRSTSRPAAPWR